MGRVDRHGDEAALLFDDQTRLHDLLQRVVHFEVQIQVQPADQVHLDVLVQFLGGPAAVAGVAPQVEVGQKRLARLLFFGLVAVNGAFYVQLEELEILPLGLSISVGFLATAILVVNNVRDMDTDRRANKITLAVRIGRAWARRLYSGLMIGSFVVLVATLVIESGPWWSLLGLLALPLARGPIVAVNTHTDGPTLNKCLAQTGAVLGVFALFTSIGLVIAA